MNFVGKFDATLPADGPGTQHSHAYVHIDSPHAQVPADAIIVPDAHLLFNADFKRSGVDLILSKDDHELVLHDYFKGDRRAPLASPDGAHLTGDLVNALTGHVQYSQAGGAPAAASQVIGHVTKLAGSATVTRNGVSIILHQGDNVEKSDVVQAGANSTLGITFIDGTVFGLSSNARMVLNEMVYDPNGSNNSSLISLVAGTISFVAGETAKHGDMKIDTPVATMGIRGTAVLVEIDFTVPQGANQPDAKFQVLVEPDGTTGSYILFDKTTLQPIAVVNQAGQQVNINNGVVSTSASQLSPELQKLITDVFTQKFASNDTKSTQTAQTDTADPNLITGLTIKTSSGATATPIFLVTNPGSSSIPQPLNGPSPTLFHIAQAPTVTPVGDGIKEIPLTTGNHTLDLTFNKIGFTDINQGDRPTVSTSFNDFTFTDAQGHDLTALVKNNPKYAHWFADIKATEVDLVVTPDPNNTNNGSATWVYNIADSAFDFLAKGETLTLTYNAVVDNNFTADPTTEKATQTFTIIITGTNDVPVITTGPQTIAFSGGTKTVGGPLTTSDATSGTLTFTDVDLSDSHTKVTTALTSAVLTGSTAVDGPLADFEKAFPGPAKAFEAALLASVTTDSTGTGTGIISWQLADLPAYLADFIPAGQKLTLTYTVTVTDSQNAVSLPETITVTIGGNNPAAVVWIETRPAPASDPSPGNWNEGSHWETGNVPTATDDAIIITNQLQNLTPYYPVTIDGSTSAAANSLTMNDFSDTPPELDVLSGGTLTIGTTLSLSADSILRNSGRISLGQGGDFQDQSSVTNTGTIEVKGGTLNVRVDVANTDGITPGQITVDSGATLALSAGTIDGGAVTINGTLDLQGTSFLKNGKLANNGQVNVSGIGALDNETVTANHILEVTPGGTLTIDQGSKVTNTGGIIGIQGGAGGIGTLTVNDAAIDGGQVLNSGAIKLTGAGVLENGSLFNFNYTLVSGLDNALHNETVAVGGSLVILSGGALTVDQGSKVTNPYSWEVNSGGTLALNDATINTGVVYNDPGGTIDLTGSAVIKNGWFYNFGKTNVSGTGNALHNENVTDGAALEVLAGGALTIDQGSVVDNTKGTITVDGTGTLTLNGATINGGTINDYSTNASGSIIAGDIDVTGNGTIAGASLNNGNLKIEQGISLTLDNVTVSGTTFDDTASGAVIQVDGNTTLTLHGATINGGTINDYSTNASGSIIAGDIDVTADSTITGASLNKGDLKIEQGISLTLDNVAVVGTSIEVDGGASPTFGNLILTNGTTISGSLLTIDSGDRLTLNGATINGGTINDYSTNASGSIIAGDIDVTADTTITGASLNNGDLKIEQGISLTLDNVAVVGTSIEVDGLANSTVGNLILTNGTTISGSQLTIDSGDQLTLNGATITGGSVTVLGTGTIVGFGTISDALVNNGTLEAKGGTLDVTGAISAGGSAKIDQAATLELGGPSAQGVLFDGSAATLKLDDPFHFSGHITGLVVGDTIEVATAANVTVTTATLDGSTLTVTESNGQILTFNVAGQLIENDFHINNLAGGGADLVLSADPLAETPSLAGTPASVTGPEDTAIALDIAAALSADASNDPDSSLSLKITGIPADATLSNTNGDPLNVADDGSISITAAQLAAGVLNGLSITPHSADEAGFTLHVTATNTDGTGPAASTASTSQDIAVNLTPVADPPNLVVAGATGAEDTAIALSIAPALTADVDPDSSLSLKITGIPADATLSNTNGDPLSVTDGSISFTAAQLAAGVLTGLSITPTSADEAGFTLHVTATDTDGTALASTSHDIVVTVTPVADAPSLAGTLTTASGAEETPIALTILDALSGETDADAVLGSITISSVPAGVTLSAGTHVTADDGTTTWTLTAAQLSGLTLTGDGEAKSFSLHVDATSNDGGNIAHATTDIAVTVNPVADAPSLAGTVTTVSGNEDIPIALTIADALSESDADAALGSITISEVPAGVTLSAGTHVTADDGTTTWTLTAAQLSGLTLTGDGEAKSFSLHVDATTNDGGNIAHATTDIAVTVNPVADAPSLAGTVTTVSGNEDIPITLTIADALSEVDADSSLGTITISNVPTGVTFNHGIVGANNTWTLSPTDLAGLKINIPDSDQGNFTLSVVGTTNDGGNIATSAATSIAVTVNPVAEAPSLAGTQTTVNVNEDSSASLTIVDTLSEVDPDSSLGTITISGVPTGVTFNHGHAGANHTWTLNPATDLAGLQINIPDNDQGNFTLSVVGTTNDGGNIATSAATSIAVSLNAPSLAGTPTTVNLPKHSGEGSGSANFTIVDTLNDPSDPDASLGAITISGVPTGVSFNHGHAGANNTWTLTPAQLSGLKILYPDGNQNFTLTVVATSNDDPSTGASAPLSIAVNIAPAGVAGHPINLALADASDGGHGGPTTVTITGAPTNWTLNGGTSLGNGTWTVQTSDPSSLTITPAANFAGAVQLGVTESSTLADGSISSFSFSDNLEAYSAGSPIFALSGDDHLSGAGASDLFVFSQPIGNDIIYNFNAASDKIDLIGFGNFGSFSDIQANLTDDANGNALITFGISETITLQGVHATSLMANDFVFDQVPVTTNAGSMTISDGATLPLSGTINNTGTIALNSTGTETDLQIIEHGVTLEGAGQVILSDSAENVISGTSADVTLTNVDNTIDGGGDLGGGRLTLINDSHGTIAATAFNQLTIDTGAGSFTNHGMVLSNGAGGLEVKGDIFSDGMLEARAGLLKVDGDVSGGGHAMIDGGNIEFVAASDAVVQFSGSSGGTLVLDDPTHFTGQIAGISGSGDVLDLRGFDAVHDPVVASTGAGSYDSGTNTTSLLVKDQTTDQSVTLKLTGDYSASTWTVADDGHGGANIVDPSASGVQASTLTLAEAPAGPVPTVTMVGNTPNQTMTSIGSSDNFVFNFAAVGHDTVTDFRPATDTLQFAGSVFAVPQAALNATQDDGHGNTVIVLDPNDTITLTGVLKAQLHVTDFHVV